MVTIQKLCQPRELVIRHGINQTVIIAKTVVRILPMKIFMQMEHMIIYVEAAYLSFTKKHGGD